MQPESRLHEKVLQWFEIAEEDLRLAKFTFRMDSNIPYRMIAFHCQQAVEKYLKAILVFSRIDFPYTHDLRKLIELIPKEYDFTDKMMDAAELTEYAVNRRYPDFYQTLSKEDAERAVVVAETVKEIVQNVLLARGLHLPL